MLFSHFNLKEEKYRFDNQHFKKIHTFFPKIFLLLMEYTSPRLLWLSIQGSSGHAGYTTAWDNSMGHKLPVWYMGFAWKNSTLNNKIFQDRQQKGGKNQTPLDHRDVHISAQTSDFVFSRKAPNGQNSQLPGQEALVVPKSIAFSSLLKLSLKAHKETTLSLKEHFWECFPPYPPNHQLTWPSVISIPVTRPFSPTSWLSA